MGFSISITYRGTVPAKGARMKKNLILLFVAVVTFSCMPAFKLPAAFNSSPRSAYEKKLKRNFPALAGWQLAHENALAAPRDIKLPHGGKGVFNHGEFPVYSYRFEMQVGEVLHAEVLTNDLDQNIFIDLYQANATAEPVQSNARNVNLLEFEIRETTTYLLTIQPEANTDSRCTVLVNSRPLYAFPVAGKGNAAIQSFWQAPRDGGKRSHEGIDIFAQKGTPVLAVTAGIVSDTGDRGLGGKQVWQRAGMFGHSIYYAHLDQIAVGTGEAVKTGDTLGYVGNTGNARGGAPHLHFGIYDGWLGAINPLPFVYRQKQIEAKDVDRGFSKKNATGIKG